MVDQFVTGKLRISFVRLEWYTFPQVVLLAADLLRTLLVFFKILHHLDIG